MRHFNNKKSKNFLDDKSKNKGWWNLNFCYLGTILFLAIIGFCFSNDIETPLKEVDVWSQFDLTNLWISFTNIFQHNSLIHIFHNSIMIAVGGVYIERKTGTLKFIMLLLVFAFVGGAMTSTCANSLAWQGASVVWFALFGYILVDYLFSFHKTKRNKTNIILGAVILIIEYIRAGFYDKIGGGIGWTIEPQQLIYNTGHYVGFIVGIIFALTVCLSQVGRYNKEQ